MRYSISNRQKVADKTRIKFSTKFLWGLVLSLVFLQIFFKIHIASSASDFMEIQRQITKITQENRRQAELLVKSTSLLELDKEAENLGFRKEKEVLNINVNDSFASLLP